MTARFVDTSFWLALILRRDAMHAAATRWMQLARQWPLVTSEWVTLEVLDGVAGAGPAARSLAVRFLVKQESDLHLTVIPIIRDVWSAALDQYQQYQDKSWGITDVTSFVIMRDRGITEALTHDHHFQQAGFRALLREAPPAS